LKCPSSENSDTQEVGGDGARLSTLVGVEAVLILNGEGTLHVSVMKNGEICDEKTVSGKGRFSARATCH
jgi:hypothetical protein